MVQAIYYSSVPPEDFKQLEAIYDALEWNSIDLTVHEMKQMCLQSWYCIYAYDEQRLVGMGRVISDGIITGVICGLCVHPDYQSQGIGTGILQRIAQNCERLRVIPQLMCEEGLESYYESLGFQKFTIGMKKNIQR